MHNDSKILFTSTFVKTSPYPEKFSFFTDGIVSTEWLNIVPRQHMFDYFEIHILH